MATLKTTKGDTLDTLRVVQSKDVVQHVVRLALGQQVEHLRISLGQGFLVKLQLAGDHDQDVAVGRRRLGVESQDLVDDLAERQVLQLGDDGLGPLDLRRLKRQHRVLAVQVAQLAAVQVERLVVEVAELLGHSGKVNYIS